MKKIILGMGLLFSLAGCTKELSTTDKPSLLSDDTVIAAPVSLTSDTTPAFSSLVAALKLKVSKIAIQLIGDSTGNEETEWFYLMVKWILTQFPTYIVEYHYWVLANDNYSSTVKTVYGSQATSTSPRLIVYNGSMAGAGIAYMADTNRLKKLISSTADYKTIMISCSHNDRVVDTGTSYINMYNTLVNRIKKRTTKGQIIITTQNPENPPVSVSRINSHSIRRGKILKFASDHSIRTVDPFPAFYNQSVDIKYLLKDDGLHPNATGEQLWADEEIKVFKQAL